MLSSPLRTQSNPAGANVFFFDGIQFIVEVDLKSRAD